MDMRGIQKLLPVFVVTVASCGGGNTSNTDALSASQPTSAVIPADSIAGSGTVQVAEAVTTTSQAPPPPPPPTQTPAPPPKPAGINLNVNIDSCVATPSAFRASGTASHDGNTQIIIRVDVNFLGPNKEIFSSFFGQAIVPPGATVRWMVPALNLDRRDQVNCEVVYVNALG